MVSDTLTLTFNLLPGLYSSLIALPSSLRLGDAIVLELECVGVKGFLRFSR